MYLQNIMSNYLNESKQEFTIEDSFKPLTVSKKTWNFEEKRATKEIGSSLEASLEIEMNENLPFCMYNSMDINHAEHIHSGVFGFGSDIPIKNYKHIKRNNNVIYN